MLNQKFLGKKWNIQELVFRKNTIDKERGKNNGSRIKSLQK